MLEFWAMVEVVYQEPGGELGRHCAYKELLIVGEQQRRLLIGCSFFKNIQPTPTGSLSPTCSQRLSLHFPVTLAQYSTSIASH